jgi:long-chain acyl-CoA synthetase
MNATVIAGQQRVSINNLRNNAAKVAAGLRSLGLKQGCSIAIMMRNDLPYLEAMLGAAQLGVYAASINWHLKGEEAAFILNDCNAKVLVVHADFVPELQGHLPPDITVVRVDTPPEIQQAYNIDSELCHQHADTLEWYHWRDQFTPLTDEPPAGVRNSIIYTSGTTGTPKGIRRCSATAKSIEDFQRVTASAYGIKSGIKAAMTGPLYHSATNGYALQVLRFSNDLVLLPRFDEQELLQTIETHRITHMHMVPTMFIRLLKLPEAVRTRYDLSSLEYVVHGAAPCPVDVKRQMIEWWGPVIHEYYGSSEAGLMTSINSADWLQRPGSVGQSLSDTHLKILDNNGDELAAGDVGEIFVEINEARDFTYHGNHQLRQSISKGNYISNGDVGYLDDEGFLHICDRKKDMIISGGVNIYPSEIEDVLATHPAIKDSAVFGIPHEEYGESIAAAIETVSDISEAEVKAFVRSRLANYKTPKVVSFHDALPREDSGKIFKRKLRDKYWQNTQRAI